MDKKEIEVKIDTDDIIEAIGKANSVCISKYVTDADKFDACRTGVSAMVDEIIIKKGEVK